MSKILNTFLNSPLDVIFNKNTNSNQININIPLNKFMKKIYFKQTGGAESKYTPLNIQSAGAAAAAAAAAPAAEPAAAPTPTPAAAPAAAPAAPAAAAAAAAAPAAAAGLLWCRLMPCPG